MSWASSPAVRRSMQGNKSRNTRPELRLKALLRLNGIRYRSHPRLPGTPDVRIAGRRVVVEVRGDFWHGRLPAPKAHRDYWLAKFARNRARDRRTMRALKARGWAVVVIWESGLARDPTGCVRRIVRACSGAA